MADNPETDQPDDAEGREPGRLGFWRGQEAVIEAKRETEVKSPGDLLRLVDPIGHIKEGTRHVNGGKVPLASRKPWTPLLS
jgi:hypothetical protein